MFVQRMLGYLDFVEAIADKADLKKRLDADPGMAAREKQLADAVEGWWKNARRELGNSRETSSWRSERG